MIVIPDVHQRKFWRNYIDNKEKIIFLGDYFDPYVEDNLEENPIDMMNYIISLKKENPDKYILLLGNHDGHYIWDEFSKGSRYSTFYAKEYSKLFNDNLDLFNICYVQDDVIFSHAGITKEWASMCFPDLSILEIGNKLASIKLSDNALEFGYLDAISFYRGGWCKAGSCIWADIHEHVYEDNPVKYDCFQVFGHTQISKPIITDTWSCLDCKQGFIINTLTHEIKEYQI